MTAEWTVTSRDPLPDAPLVRYTLTDGTHDIDVLLPSGITGIDKPALRVDAIRDALNTVDGWAAWVVPEDPESWLPAGEYLIELSATGVTLAHRRTDVPNPVWGPPVDAERRP